MKIRSSYMVIILLPLFFGIMGNACCPKTIVEARSIIGIELSHMNQNNYDTIDQGDTTFLSISLYGISLRHNLSRSTASVSIFQPSTLYATEACEPYNYYFSEKVLDIQIYSTNDLNNDYPAGSSLTDVFHAGTRRYPETIENLIGELSETFFEDPQVMFWLEDSVAIQRAHRFIVEYELEGGGFISDTTSLVYLTD